MEHELARGAAEKDFELSFMGMGEPLANWSCVRSAIAEIRILYPDVSRIAISTSGPAPRVERLVRELPTRPFIHLQISLHATNDGLRHWLIPHASGSIAELLAAGRLFHERTGDHVCLNYALLQGLNDNEADAEWLARLDREVFYIKVTQLNQVPNLPPDIVGSSLAELYQFCGWLEKRRMPHKLFIGDGLDVQASCGQMASIPIEVKSSFVEDLV
jgi:23S rRNA (adenine2503-C2)-methyltransferase